MGKALLITLAGIIIALSYTFFGMANRGQSMTERNVSDYKAVKAKNIAHTGVQVAIEEYNNRKSDSDESNDEFTDVSKFVHGADLTLTLDEDMEVIDGENTEVIIITSRSNFEGTEHEVISTFDISQNQALVPEFVAALSIANGSFDFSMGGSSSINGNDASNTCTDKPGITVPDLNGVNKVGEQPDVAGNPPGKAVVDNSINFDEVSDLIDQLSPLANHISGNYKGNLGTKENPVVTFVDNYTKLAGGIEDGHGILVVRSAGELDFEGELDVAGNLNFNGLVIFENAYSLKGRGTPNINGSIIVGYSDPDSNTNIDISGNIHLQYDCDAQKYADEATNSVLNTTLYQQLSIYE
jgi:hypothetical protein